MTHPSQLPIDLEHYREPISLDDPRQINPAKDWRRSLQLVAAGLGISVPGNDPKHLLQRLHGALASLPPHTLTEQQTGDVEAIAAAVNAERGTVIPTQSTPLPKTATTTAASANVSLVVGDITRLEVDAIVNAANHQMIGCRLPHHPCIDNAIHTAAGPRLRDDCSTIMKLQGEPEPVGSAKITRGHALPSRYVLHTVGPQLQPGESPTASETRDLASSYTSCLDLAARIASIRTVAFCAISTGVFAFPRHEAAHVALGAIVEWVDRNPGRLDRIIIDCFTEHDAEPYRIALDD